MSYTTRQAPTAAKWDMQPSTYPKYEQQMIMDAVSARCAFVCFATETGVEPPAVVKGMTPADEAKLTWYLNDANAMMYKMLTESIPVTSYQEIVTEAISDSDPLGFDAGKLWARIKAKRSGEVKALSGKQLHMSFYTWGWPTTSPDPQLDMTTLLGQSKQATLGLQDFTTQARK